MVILHYQGRVLREEYEGDFTKLTLGFAERSAPNGSMSILPRVAPSSMAITAMAMVFSPLWFRIPSGT